MRCFNLMIFQGKSYSPLMVAHLPLVPVAGEERSEPFNSPALPTWGNASAPLIATEDLLSIQMANHWCLQ